MTEQQIQAASSSLWTARHGKGEPLLLLPGMMSHHGYWRPAFREALLANHELIELDHRGTGASSPARDRFDIAALAGDAAEALDSLGLHRVKVFGFSMGGAVALELALRRPDAVEALILGAPAVSQEGTATEKSTVAEILRALQSGDLDRSLSTAWTSNVSAAFARDSSGYRDWTQAAGAYRMSMQTINHQLAALDEYRPHAELDRLRARTLVLHGSEDQVVAPQRSASLVQQLPHAELYTIEGAGHLFFWERPTESAELIARWLATPGKQDGGKQQL